MTGQWHLVMLALCLSVTLGLMIWDRRSNR